MENEELLQEEPNNEIINANIWFYEATQETNMLLENRFDTYNTINKIPLNVGYTVQPVPAPPSTKEDSNNKLKEGGNNQKLMLFIRGNAISGAPIKIGTKKLPKPPIKIGITIKKIITNACAVTNTLYN